MTAETSNARGEWAVLLERAVPFLHDEGAKYDDDGSNEPLELAREIETLLASLPSDESALSSASLAFDGGREAATPPPPADAEPKTLPVPTRVYLTDKAAVIVGDPQCGWDEEGPDAHNCDAMECATIGPHVLARVPFTDERAMSQPEASAPVGVEEVVMAARNAENTIRNCAAAGQIGDGYVQYADALRDAVQRLAQQPAAVDRAARRRDVRLWMRHNAGSYSTATELAEAADEVFNLPDGGLDNETHWVWDEAAEAVDDSQRGGLA